MANEDTNTAGKSNRSKTTSASGNINVIGKQNRLDILVQTALDYLKEGGNVTFAGMEGGGVVIELHDVHHDEANKRLIASSASIATGKPEVGMGGK